MQLFYQPNLDHSVSQFQFSPEESKHLIKVLRKKEGDTIAITNGKGDIYEAEILTADLKWCRAKIVGTTKRHPKMYRFHLAVAPTKNLERFEWFLEKATEIGVHEITPVICERSERKTVKKERMERIIATAMKQSLQAYLPKLNGTISLDDFLARPSEGLLFIAHCEEEEKAELKRRMAPDKDVTILIGPEGDFSVSEIKKTYEKGYLPVSLGKNRLRTETAAVVACTIVNTINNV
ncbi:MAG: 16S rRNA (uracil(1498)-N(3))-methyltransferase [Bacteroidota bacterium]